MPEVYGAAPQSPAICWRRRPRRCQLMREELLMPTGARCQAAECSSLRSFSRRRSRECQQVVTAAHDFPRTLAR